MCQECADDSDCGEYLCDTNSSNHTCEDCYEDSQCTTNICLIFSLRNFCGECRTDADCVKNSPTTYCGMLGECELRCDDVNSVENCTIAAGVCDTTRSPVCIYDDCPNGNSGCTGSTDSYDLQFICDDSDIRDGTVECNPRLVSYNIYLYANSHNIYNI